MEQEMRAMTVRERGRPNFVRMRIDAWKDRRGSLMLTPSGANPHLNGSRIIQLTDRIQIDGLSFRATWNTELPRHALLTARFDGTGSPSELIEDPHLGLVATNEWPEELQGQVRYVGVEQEGGTSNHRVIRFEATEAIVNHIQRAGGTIAIGFGRCTIRSNRKPVKAGSTVVYRLQK